MAVKYQGGRAVPVKPYSRELDLVWSDIVAIGVKLKSIRDAKAAAIASVPGATQALSQAQDAIRNAARVLRTFDE